MALTYHDVVAARDRLQGYLTETPLYHETQLSRELGFPLYLKAENLQRTGSFKIRGALARLMTLSAEEKERGVIAASAGNHAQGVALAAALLGVRATVVMPQGVPITKLTATRAHGARVVLFGETYDDAYKHACTLQADEQSTFVHAFADYGIMAGQGTVGLEIVAALPDVETVVVPVGGGGLIAGMATALKTARPGLRLIGVQAAGAPAVYLSKQRGELVKTEEARSIADGIAVKHPDPLNLEIIERLVDEVVLISEEEIAAGVLTLLERCKLLVEGAGAAGVGALLAQKIGGIKGPTVAVLSGGNIDVNIVSRIIERGLVQAGRNVRLSVLIPDRPGSLQRLLAAVAETGANVVEIHHERWLSALAIGEVEVDLALETVGPEHVQRLMETIRAAGYRVSATPPAWTWENMGAGMAPGGP